VLLSVFDPVQYRVSLASSVYGVPSNSASDRRAVEEARPVE